MGKTAVIFWSGTGNTEAMAEAVFEGAKSVNPEAKYFNVSDITASEAAEYDNLALGCPAMGAEVLEEDEFEPFFTELEVKLSGKNVALFGSYGWGDGEWMRNWIERSESNGANLVDSEGLTVNDAPDEDSLQMCRELGKKTASL